MEKQLEENLANSCAPRMFGLDGSWGRLPGGGGEAGDERRSQKHLVVAQDLGVWAGTVL